MRKCFDWLVRHEKFVVAITISLVIALVVQMKFCKTRVEPEATLILNPPLVSQISTSPSPGSTTGISGTWEMSIKRKKGGTQIWTLTLEQNGEILTGVLNSEGGDLPVTGTIKGKSINLAAKRFGVTLEIPATLNGDTMTGTMHALTVTLHWTAKRM
jgi:hypothetical protein